MAILPPPIEIQGSPNITTTSGVSFGAPTELFSERPAPVAPTQLTSVIRAPFPTQLTGVRRG